KCTRIWCPTAQKWKSLVEDLLPRAFGIDEVENRRKYEQCQEPNQNCVRHSDLASFQIRVGRRFPDDKPGENDHRDKGKESEIDQQIVFDHGFDPLTCFTPALAPAAASRSWTPVPGTRRCGTCRPRSPPGCGRSRFRRTRGYACFGSIASRCIRASPTGAAGRNARARPPPCRHAKPRLGARSN